MDGAPSCWLIPYCHEFAVLAGAAAWDELTPAARDALRPRLEASVAAMRAFAEQGDVNFAHRVALLEAASFSIDGLLHAAIGKAREALAVSEAGGLMLEVVLAHDLLTRLFARAARDEDARRSATDALEAYARWGAAGVVRQRTSA